VFPPDRRGRRAIRARLARTIGDAKFRCILGMDFKQRFAPVLRQGWRQAGACHRVPLIAIPPGVEPQREARVNRRIVRCFNRNEASLAIRMAEALRQWMRAAPLEWLEPFILRHCQIGEVREVQRLAMRLCQGCHGGIVAKDLRLMRMGKRRLPAHPSCKVTQYRPIGAGLSGWRKQRALAADPAFAIGDCAVLFSPGKRGQANMGEACGVGIGHDVGHNQGFAPGECFADEPCIGH